MRLILLIAFLLAGCNQSLDSTHVDTHCMTTEKGSVTLEDCSIDRTSKSHSSGF